MMSDMSSILAELRRLKDIKDENRECLERYDEINNEISAQSQDALSEFAIRLNDCKEKHSDNLDKFIPENVYKYDKDIPVCASTEIKPLYPIAGLCFYAAVIFLVLSSVLNIETGLFISFLCAITLLVCGAIWFFNNDKIGNYFEWKNARKKWLADASKNEANKQDLLNTFKIFDDAFFNEMEVFAKEEDQVAEEYLSVTDKIKAPYKAELDMLYDKMAKCVYELSNSEILHEDNVPYLEDILRNIETGRADSLKESINIALEDERKDNEENARRQEARRQEEILQEQAYQNKLHNMEMQRKADDQAMAARQHAAIMEKQAAIQIKETQKLREEIKRQNNKK